MNKGDRSMKSLSNYSVLTALLLFLPLIAYQEPELTTFEKFTELSQDLRKVIMSFAAQSIQGNNLADIITNFTNLISVNKEWFNYLNSPHMTNAIVHELVNNQQVITLLNQLRWNSQLPALAQENFKIILLVLLNTPGAQAQLQELKNNDPQGLQAIFNMLVYYFAYILPPIDVDASAQTSPEIIKTIITIEQRLISQYIALFGKQSLSTVTLKTFLHKVQSAHPRYYSDVIRLMK